MKLLFIFLFIVSMLNGSERKQCFDDYRAGKISKKALIDCSKNTETFSEHTKSKKTDEVKKYKKIDIAYLQNNRKNELLQFNEAKAYIRSLNYDKKIKKRMLKLLDITNFIIFDESGETSTSVISGLQYTDCLSNALKKEEYEKFSNLINSEVKSSSYSKKYKSRMIKGMAILMQNLMFKARFEGDDSKNKKQQFKEMAKKVLSCENINKVQDIDVFSSLQEHQQVLYDKSFKTTYKTKDFNDPNILFYIKELEKNMKEFIEADDLYGRFEYDVKSDIAQDCISYHLKLHKDDEWIEHSYNFSKNARNKYANTEELIKKAKKNESLMGKHFYTYDLNIVNHVIEELTSSNATDKSSPCQSKIPVDKLYDIFLNDYMEQYKDSNIKSPFSKPQEREIKWYSQLKKLFPEVEKNIQHKKFIKEQEIKRKRKLKLQKDIFLFAKGINGYTTLKEALELGVDINLKNSNGQTPLIVAAIKENANGLMRLINNGSDTTIKDKFGKRAIDYLNKDSRAYSTFVAFKALRDAPKYKGQKKVSVVKFDKKTGKTEVKHQGVNRETWSPLHLAIEKFEQKKVKKLIDSRQYLEDKTNNGSSPLTIAVILKNNEAFEWLVDANVNLESKNRFGITPLFIAVMKKNHYAAKRLLELGVEMYGMEYNKNYFPLSYAVSNNDVEMVKLFLEHGVDVNYQFNKTETALTIAGRGCSNINLFKLLLEHGANPDIKDKYGFSTRSYLSRYCSTKDKLEKFEKLMEKY